METSNHINLEPRQKALLSAVLTEVLYGFSVPDFKGALGWDKSELTTLHDDLKAAPTEVISLDSIQRRVLAAALRLTLHELGEEEFRTRTGYEYDEGEAVLRRLASERPSVR